VNTTELWQTATSGDLAKLVRSGDAARRAELLKAISQEIRRTTLHMIVKAKAGHIGGDYSITDAMATLFFAVANLDPKNPSMPERDRFVLSKGHCAGALYSTLALMGFFPREWLDTYMAPLSPLNGHPNRRKVPGVEANTGPLGHGLPIGVGCAIAAKLAGSKRRAFIFTGDGELQEGSNWEAAMAAGHRGLDNLCVVVDRNRFQQGRGTEETNRLDPLDDKWKAFGWEVRMIDGHDHNALFDAFTAPAAGKPRCIIANTTKGKGVSFMENRAEWHHKVPSAEQVELAVAELSR
jgi:transketolase